MKPLSDYISLNEVKMVIGPNYFKAVVPVVELKKSIERLKKECNNKSTVDTDNTIKIWDLFKIIDENFGEKLI